MILNVVSPLLPSCWGYSFALGCGVSFFGVIQHSPVDGCSAASCNFGVLTKDENISFYSTTFLSRKDIFFIIGDWNVKVGSQKIHGITGKFDLGVQKGQRLAKFCQENTGHSKHPLPTIQEKTLHMDITRWPTPKSD